MRPRSAPSRCARAFTLAEVLIVVTILAILAVSAIPAMDAVAQARQGIARDEIVRMLEYTRSRAVASGRPSGLRVERLGSVLSLVEIEDDGAIDAMPDPLGSDEPALYLERSYPGVTIDAVDAQTDSTGTIWFNYKAQPHARNADGSFGELNTADASITLSNGDRVVVHAYSGFVEVSP